ncbi:hypothetical protein KM043_003765 [Ampulex compressa]|nr:hypothetical protein KM043_003765 [Ampulex compressa]
MAERNFSCHLRPRIGTKSRACATVKAIHDSFLPRQSSIEENTRHPEKFLSVQDRAAVDFRNCVKSLYDFTKELTRRETNALPELVTEGFDEEQIWQQLELQNEGELDHLLGSVSKLLATKKELTLPVDSTKPKEPERTAEDSKEDTDLSDEESIEDDDAAPPKRAKKQSAKRHKSKPSIVDDKFFKLQELDEYLTKEEKKQTKVGEQEQSEQESEDESVDLFDDFSEDEEEDTDEAKLVKYADFFDNPQSEDEGRNESTAERNLATDDDDSLRNSDEEDNAEEEGGEEKYKSPAKRVKFNLTNDSDETDSLENKSGERKDDARSGKSSLEMRRERLQKKIGELEEEALAEKPWQLKGEVSASSRPQNSLLEEFVEFDVTTRPAPVITEQTTLRLEDIIKQRIKDKAWDDVEKKFKPVETPLEYKKKLILDQEKSKESLSQIYEKEYLRQKQALDPESKEREEEEPKLHVEIREMMHGLLSKLDALSNFHYTPKRAQPELKVISNIPAIDMEEVAPVTTSEATLLAPEEIKEKPRGDLIGKAERTATDMKRDRRRKKQKQHLRQKHIEEKEKLKGLQPGVAKKYRKDKNAELLKKLTKDRNIVKMDETSQKIAKSSTAFFNQLQDQVKSHVKSKAGTIQKKKPKNAVSAVKLKL